MSFNELIKLLEAHGFRVIKQRGSIRWYAQEGYPYAIRVDYHGHHEVPKGTLNVILKMSGIKGVKN